MRGHSHTKPDGRGAVMGHVVPAKSFSQDEALVEAIRKISAGMLGLQRSGLNRRAIVALLHDHTRVGKVVIEQVLDSLATLERTYCEPRK